MSCRILIVDSIATNRIMLRATLQGAHYDVTPCASVAEAETMLGRADHDIVLIDITRDEAAALMLCSAIKANPAMTGVGVIALSSGRNGPARIAALRAGADDVLDRDAGQALMLACIRSLLRARNTALDVSLHGAEVTGFAEAAEGFAGPGRVALISGRAGALPQVLRRVIDRHAGPVTLIAPGQDMTDTATTPPADLYIIDGTDALASGLTQADLFRIVSDLRSSATTHHAASLVVLPEMARDLAAMALDLGANDQVTDQICADEFAHRVRGLMRRKLRADRQRDQLQFQLQEANLDPLTGLFNRRHAQRRLERMAEAAGQSGSAFALMMLDIDHFKAINDTHGHDAGDRVLVAVAQRLRDNLRAVDLVARIGGEEFLVAMPDTSIESAQGAAERLRRMIESAPFDTASIDAAREGKSPLTQVTLSIGVAVGPPETPSGQAANVVIAGLCKQADLALYAAKEAGRNTVSMCAA